MNNTALEHINVTVSDPDHAAALLGRLFDWEVRWSGQAMAGGYTVHVGSKDHYLALYRPKSPKPYLAEGGKSLKNLNHIGVQVEDLWQVKERLQNEGIETFNFGEYEPGKRFYFYMDDELEVEVISYSS